MRATREQLETGAPVGIGFSAALQLVEGVVYCYHPRDKSIWWTRPHDSRVPAWNAGKGGMTPIIPPRDPGAAALWGRGFNSRNKADATALPTDLIRAAEHRAADWSYRPRAQFRRQAGLTLWTVKFSSGQQGAVAWTWEGLGKYPNLETVERCREAPLQDYPHHTGGGLPVEPANDEVHGLVVVRQYGGPMWVLVEKDEALSLALHRHVGWREWVAGDGFATEVRDGNTTSLTTEPKHAWVRIIDGRVISARATRGYDQYL